MKGACCIDIRLEVLYKISVLTIIVHLEWHLREYGQNEMKYCP